MCTVILVGGISRSTFLSLRTCSDRRRTKLFDAPKSTRARSDTFVVTSMFKVMRGTSSPGATTHNDCVLGATFVKRFANSLDVAGSVGRSAPTDPDRFLTVRYVVALSQQRRVLVPGPSWPVDGRCAQCCEALGEVHYTHRRNGLFSDRDCMLAFVGYLENEDARSLYRRGPWVQDLRPPVVLRDDRLPNGHSLVTAKVLLFRCIDRLIKRF